MTRPLNDDDPPLLPPMSEPPARPLAGSRQAHAGRAVSVAGVERVVAERGVVARALAAQPVPPVPPVPPRGIPSLDPARATLAEQVVLNNKFRLIRLLYSNDDEIVYLALHTSTGRQVQLHVLPSGFAVDS